MSEDDFQDIPEAVLHEDFGDPETMLNSRDWLQSALESKGATWLGGGVGMGDADIDIELEGVKYNIRIRPILN